MFSVEVNKENRLLQIIGGGLVVAGEVSVAFSSPLLIILKLSLSNWVDVKQPHGKQLVCGGWKATFYLPAF